MEPVQLIYIHGFRGTKVNQQVVTICFVMTIRYQAITQPFK